MDIIWADQSDKRVCGPFDGLLMVLNVGNDSYPPRGWSQAYEDALIEAMTQAHYDGWAIVYLFDHGTSMPPTHFDFIEDMDFLRLTNTYCGSRPASKGCDFSLLPQERDEEIAGIAAKIIQSPEFSFPGTPPVKVVGSCRIGGEEVLLPLTEVRPWAKQA